jgi:hypothetical protein
MPCCNPVAFRELSDLQSISLGIAKTGIVVASSGFRQRGGGDSGEVKMIRTDVRRLEIFKGGDFKVVCRGSFLETGKEMSHYSPLFFHFLFCNSAKRLIT